MKKSFKSIIVLTFVAFLLVLSGCSKASRVSYNVSRNADEFKVVRKVTVINGITGEILYQMTGRMSIEHDQEENQLEILAVDVENNYKKHFVGLSDNISYIVEDVTGSKDVDYQYKIYFNPKMIVPIDVELSE